MTDISANNTKIAKNTVYLYTRTAVLLTVSLLTSRFLLKALGVEELGIYNVVGGIIAFLYFLRAAQTNATTRFITFELGNNPDLPESKIYPICYTIHIILALVVILIGETVGFFILNNWTNIPEDRQFAAHLVYHFSLLQFSVNILRVPFDSVVISHENMKMYAYISSVEVILQFCGVLLLKYYNGDRLVAYSVLLLTVTTIVFVTYAIVIRCRYRKYKIKWVWDKRESINVLSFSGWSLLGSTSDAITQQGVGLLFNNFVSLVANTALGFAYQVRSAVGTFVGSFTMAFNPQIIKRTAQNDKSSLQSLIVRASKLSFVLAFLLALPLLLNLDFALGLWLDNVPLYTKGFCIVVIISALFDATSCFFNTAVCATGDIRNYQICIALSFTLDFIGTFLLLFFDFYPALAFSCRIFARGIINMIIGIIFCHSRIQLSVKKYCFEVLKPISITVIISLLICYPLSIMSTGWYKLIITFISSTIVILSCAVCLVLNKQERRLVSNAVKLRLHL